MADNLDATLKRLLEHNATFQRQFTSEMNDEAIANDPFYQKQNVHQIMKINLNLVYFIYRFFMHDL